MSTPIEVYDQETNSSVFVDEYGLVSIWYRKPEDSLMNSVELAEDGLKELIGVLTDAYDELVFKRTSDRNNGHAVSGCQCEEGSCWGQYFTIRMEYNDELLAIKLKRNNRWKSIEEQSHD